MLGELSDSETQQKKHFPVTNALAKIFTKNYVKASHSSSKSITKKAIKSHDKSNNLQQRNEKTQSNCRKKPTCRGNCLKTNIVYKAKINTNNTTMCYIETTKAIFNQRKCIPYRSFCNRKFSNSTTLSACICRLHHTKNKLGNKENSTCL